MSTGDGELRVTLTISHTELTVYKNAARTAVRRVLNADQSNICSE